MVSKRGKSNNFETLPSRAYPVAQKGYVPRLRFLQPFAPCFASAGDGQPAYLLTTSTKC